jgi:hypothetical protein
MECHLNESFTRWLESSVWRATQPTPSEETTQEGGTLFRQHALQYLNPVVEFGMIEN